MKKILCIALALTAVFCLAACEDGKCDDCKTKDNVEVYELDDKNVELCYSCLVKRGASDIIDSASDLIDGISGLFD